MNITLSPKQAEGFDQVMAWHKSDRRTFALAGFAGTGKSTLASRIAEEIGGSVAYCAFTGKAANVLREKGCPNVKTIHSWLYSLKGHNRDIILSLEKRVKEAKISGDYELMDQCVSMIEKKNAEFRKPRFERNEESELASYRLVIVDEFSMLSNKLIADLERAGKKILYLGDPFQLPPIEGECSIKPDYFLDEIHRQALDSPIVRAATAVRSGQELEFCDEGAFKYQPKRSIAAEEYSMAEQLIVGRNNTRTGWNNRFRVLRGTLRAGDDSPEACFPVVGDKMICLKNNPVLELFNGQIGFCLGTARNMQDEHYAVDFEDDAGEQHYGLQVWKGDVNGSGEKYDGYDEYHRSLQRFDYGYAITCHKSQGSEFDSVLIYDEPIGRTARDRARWRYTAITRAKNKCTLVKP